MSPAAPFIPDAAPFSAEQRAWLNGFFAGMFSRAPVAGGLPSPRETPAPLTPLTILFGSQTGTAEGLAKRVAKEAGKRNFAPTVLDMAQCDVARLAGEKNLLVLTSTYGDGEPPDNAKALHTALQAAASASEPTRSLTALRFSILALGDTNYTQFCKAGADFDLYLEKLGATRVTPRVDCDLDYEGKFSAWLNSALTALGSSAPLPSTETTATIENHKPEIVNESGYNRSRPFPALLLASRNLNAPGSAKQVHHVEFDLAGSGLAYEAGDALGVYAHNCPALVADVLAALACDGEEAVPAPDGSSVPLRRALTEFYDLGKPSPDLLNLVGATSVATGPAGVASQLFPATPHHVIDAILTRADAKLAPADFVRTLKKLQPRLYSISSSPRAHAGQVHLTVGAVRYELSGRARKGVCSTFLAERAAPGEVRIGIFVHSNKAFRPPASGDTPVIMVGPGTGIAPFRAFLHERKAAGAKGKNWLLYGDQRAATDFLYREELAALQHEGVLTRLDTAFSRDQAEKLYVQQRMTENAVELYAWLEAGAHFYVCGDASRMAKDVDAALHAVIERAGGKTADQAAAYVQALQAAKRYARDVY
ncbi:MAG: sulfite reductase subunit alpha [Opitutaceae bacterium]|nr:sulfite reductase subunit alpha [Opitutaceae bacterium]